MTNELIAEFMGGVSREKIFPEDRQIIKTSEHGNCYIENLKYDTSWDWLMPVVHKIKELQDKFHFDKRGIELVATIDKYICLVQIADACLYVSEFIKWYNSTKKS